MNTSQLVNLKQRFLKMVDFGFFGKLQLMWSQGITYLRLKKVSMSNQLKTALSMSISKTKIWTNEVLRAADKGIEAYELQKPPSGVYEGVDLRVLPKYICYKAAAMRSKFYITYVLIGVSMMSLAVILYQSGRIDYWQRTARLKEFMLVPSKIVGHTPAVPQTVPIEYAKDAFVSLVGLIGNITPTDIRRRYEKFSSYMSQDLKVQFMAQSESWIRTVEKDGVYEQIEIPDEFVPVADGTGGFLIKTDIVRARREYDEFLGNINESIEVQLRVVPPVESQEWIFEITKFKRKRI